MQGEVRLPGSEHDVLATKAWTAYVAPGLGYGILFLIGLACLKGAASVGVVLILFTVARLTYRVLFLRSYRLFQDEMGIWVYRGVFPWNKGTVGVKWRDLDEALYYNNLTSWLFKSYTIRIRHRFTKASEIALDHMIAGNLVAQGINAEHQRLVAARALT